MKLKNFNNMLFLICGVLLWKVGDPAEIYNYGTYYTLAEYAEYNGGFKWL
jgi:hypothetical protein